MDFLEPVKIEAERFNGINKSVVKIFAFMNKEGVVASSLLANAFVKKNIAFSISFIKTLNKEDIRRENCDIIFLLCDINEISSDKHLFIFNNKELSLVEAAYYFVKFLDKNNTSLAYFVMCAGDKVRDDIRKDIDNSALVEKRKGIDMFGMYVLPISKVLEYNIDPYLPGISGNKQGVSNFLNELQIEEDKINNFSEEELNKLVTHVILKRIGGDVDVFRDVYLLQDGRSINQLSFLLDFCCRIGKPSLGVSLFFDRANVKKAVEIYSFMLKDIIYGLEWFYNNKRKKRFEEGKMYVLIRLDEDINPDIVDILCSVINNAGIYPDKAVIISAFTIDGNIRYFIMNFKDCPLLGREYANVHNGYEFVISPEEEKPFLEKLKTLAGSIIMEDIVK